mgnify:FL=1
MGKGKYNSMGKFDSEETEALYEIVMNGFASESVGDVETTNAYDLVNGPFDEPPLKGYVGGIIEHMSQGFVYGEVFKSKKALEKKWEEIEKMVNADMPEED